MAALSIGARGPEVAALQKRLQALGYDDVWPDRVFGPATQAAVGDPQHRHRDSKADPATDADTAAGIARTDDAIADLEQVDEWFLEWLQGERFTERVDEPECRAIVATMVLDEMGLAGLTRVAVDAILALPDDHPRRDVARARPQHAPDGALAVPACWLSVGKRSGRQRAPRLRSRSPVLERP